MWLASLALGVLPDPASEGARAQSAVADVPPMRAKAERPFLQAIAGRPQLDITIDSPEQDKVVADVAGVAFIAGRALARYGDSDAFDVLFVVDKSDSTSEASGSDVNGDGTADPRLCVGVVRPFGLLARAVNLCEPTGDSILAAEVASVRALIRQLDPRRTRVGVVAFGGDDLPTTPDAIVAAPLTTNYRAVEQVLGRILERGPEGRTNIEAGIRAATAELVGARSIFSSIREIPQQVILFMSDGVPTLPVDGAIPQNRRLAVAAAKQAANFRIRMDTFGIGSEAVSEPETLVEMAEATYGVFTPVAQPRDLQPIF